MAWSPDGKLLALAGGADHAIHVHSVPAGGEVSLLRDVGPVSYAVFSSDGERIETLGNDGAARIWDIDTGLSAVVAHVPWAGEAVMAISPDGRTLASANWDRVAIVRCSVCSGLDELVQQANETVPRELTPREHALFVDAG